MAITVNGMSLLEYARTLPATRPSGRQGKSYYELYPERLDAIVLPPLILDLEVME